MIRIEIPDISAIDTAAGQLLESIGDYKKIAFAGEMGAGKTTIIKALCKQLGVESVVVSPTFALINEYFTKEGESIYHFDLYRIENVSEMYDFGYEDYFYSDAYCFIEWPEKAMELIPDDTLFIKIRVASDGSRTIISELPLSDGNAPS
jgi:tRNA threonylcarbamoyladenosine biosynthesis protein TsaE